MRGSLDRLHLANDVQVSSIAHKHSCSPSTRATAFICQDFTCKAPTTEPNAVKEMLRERRSTGGAAGRVQIMPVDLGGITK
jgi:hypothetical protein